MNSIKSPFVHVLLGACALLCTNLSFAQYAPAGAKSDVKVTDDSAVTGIIKSKGKGGRVMYSDHLVAGYAEDKKLVGKSFIALPKAQGSEEAAKPSNATDDTNKKIDEVNLKIKKQNCDNAKMRLGTLSSGKRVARMKEDGTTEYLSAESIETERTKTNSQIKEFCN